MKNTQKLIGLVGIIFLASCASTTEDYQTMTVTEEGYTYEYVTGDPMKTRIYTLENGLKVYLSDYDNAPRVHVFMPVKAGGKNDPATNTGLAHYLEHMMFKGTDAFGTLDFEQEKVYLDSIESMFNTYATLNDPEERQAYYEQIDAVSNEAAKFAIPNEYDKMVATLGGKGLNAYTTEDRTVYTVDIPSNEIPRFLELEGNRFRTIVNRLFHTELEAVYEEKNRSLDNDLWKSYETLYAAMFEEHPYGTQTVIGTIDHLKNPSITEIKKYFQTYYRPNNVAICMSGDLDYTETIKLIDQHFGSWEPNDNLPQWNKVEEAPITSPIAKEVFGPDAESLRMGFRFDGNGSDDYYMIKMIDMLLSNSEAGLMDLNLKQQQKVLNAGSNVDVKNDYSIHTLTGNPKQDQTLEEVQDLILGQIELIKKGEFEDWLIPAIIADFKKSKMQGLENNWSRANDMVMAFTNDIAWAEYLQEIDRIEQITKEQIVAFANANYQDNYAVVFKRNGDDPNKMQVEKPSITKVPLNRDNRSPFHEALVSKEVSKLEPVFVDYKKDISTLNVKGVEVLAKQNDENELFKLFYLLDVGSNADPKLKIAAEYLEYIGTEEYSAEELKKELYKLGCSFGVTATAERTYVTLSGLDENMVAATQLFESLLQNPQADQEALNKLTDRMLKSRADAKKQKRTILWGGLFNYGKYGAENPFTNVLANYELTQLEADELVEIIKSIPTMPHRIMYYGPKNNAQLTAFLTENHFVPEEFTALPETKQFVARDTDEPQVFWTDYDMVQSEIVFLHKSVDYDPEIAPDARFFNEYFGAGMNSIVFQEIREAQGLAYAVFSSYAEARRKEDANSLYAYVGTQADKQSEAMKAMMNLINDLPESAEAFNVAKEGILNKIESERITRSDVLWNYVSATDKGLDYDIRRDIYNDVQSMTFENLMDFHARYIKDKGFITVLIGSRDKIDFEDLKQYGKITEVSLDELFGYENPEKLALQ